MSTWPWNQFGKVKTAAELEEYLAGREYRHSYYFHYTTLSVAKSILDKRAFWLSNVSDFNDETDRKQFPDVNTYFSLCFSTGINENLPLWYLYAGADGKGARITLTNGALKSSIKCGRYTLYKKITDHSGQVSLEKIMNLHEGKTMELSFQDVIYWREGKTKGECDLKYNTMTNHIFTMPDIECYMKNHIGFCKDLVWYYEKETRLLVHLIGAAAKKITLEPKNYVVVWEFGWDLLRYASLVLAPDVELGDLDILTQPSSPSFFINRKVPITHSEYAGKVHLSPCSKCQNNPKKNNPKEGST